MSKKLDYIDITQEEVYNLKRFDSVLPKPRKGKRWRKWIKSGWLIGEYVQKIRRGPWVIRWYVADTSGVYRRIIDKAW